MKNFSKLSTLALLGLTVGMGLPAVSAEAPPAGSPDQRSQTAPAPRMMTEDELMSQLNDESKKLYQSLSPEGKELAIKIASMGCKGMNACKGQGGCKSAEHGCAGMNGCAGTGAGPLRDPNMAVKLAAKRMAEKRNGKPSSQRASSTPSTTR